MKRAKQHELKPADFVGEFVRIQIRCRPVDRPIRGCLEAGDVLKCIGHRRKTIKLGLPPTNQYVGSIHPACVSLMIERHCRVCGCTNNDCRRCIERTGKPCTWVAPDLCSACVPDEEEE